MGAVLAAAVAAGAWAVHRDSAGEGRAAEATLTDAWRDAHHLLVNEAADQFDEIARRGGLREAQLGLAVTLINCQPLTQGNVDRAAGILESLRSADDDDQTGIAAAYYLARVEQVHRFQPDPARALTLYDELAARHPSHRLGQMALVKAGMIRLFQVRPIEEQLRLFDRIAAGGKALTDPDARRDFHLMLADAATMMQLSDERALEHLIEADRAGLAKRKTAGDVWVRIGELARKLHRTDLAATYYRRFAEEFPRDERTLLVRQRLGELPASAPAEGRP